MYMYMYVCYNNVKECVCPLLLYASVYYSFNLPFTSSVMICKVGYSSWHSGSLSMYCALLPQCSYSGRHCQERISVVGV